MAGYGIQKRGSGKALKKRKHFDAGGLALQDLVNNKITEKDTERGVYIYNKYI